MQPYENGKHVLYNKKKEILVIGKPGRIVFFAPVKKS